MNNCEKCKKSEKVSDFISKILIALYSIALVFIFSIISGLGYIALKKPELWIDKVSLVSYNTWVLSIGVISTMVVYNLVLRFSEDIFKTLNKKRRKKK